MSQSASFAQLNFVASYAPQVIIVGAGPSGLACAIAWIDALRGQGVTGAAAAASPLRLRLFERDVDREARSLQGYSLSLRTDVLSGGVQVLDRFGCYDRLYAQATVSHGMALCGPDMSPYCVFRSEPVPSQVNAGQFISACRIRRYVLRDLLVEELEDRIRKEGWPVTLEWNKGVASAEEFQREVTVQGADGASVTVTRPRVRLTMLDGSKEECDLLIACDGSNSKIRHALAPKEVLKYNSAWGLSGEANFASPAKSSSSSSVQSPLPPLLAQYHVMAMSGKGQGLFMAAIDENRAIFFLSQVTPEAPPADLPQLSGKQILERAREIGVQEAGFAEPFSTLLNKTVETQAGYMICQDKLCIDHTKEDNGIASSRVLFLGDASHAVSPFAGNGANMALMDGEQLGRILAGATLPSTSQSDESLLRAHLRSLFREYDGLAIPRSNRAVKASWRTIESCHSTGWRAKVNVGILIVLGKVINNLNSIKRGLKIGLLVGGVAALAFVAKSRFNL